MDRTALLEVFVQYIVPPLATALGLGLAWVLRQASAWLAAKAATSKVAAAVARVLHFAEVVVADVEATVRPEVQKALSDGHLSKEEGDKLKAIALERLKALLGEHGLSELRSILAIASPQIDVYLGALIERVVLGFKASAPVVAPVVAPNPS